LEEIKVNEIKEIKEENSEISNEKKKIELKGIKIGKYFIEKPIVQGGMGVGISWDRLAGNVAKNGGLGTISAICTGYYQNMRFVKKAVNGRPLGTENAYNREALFEIFKNARKICGDKPLACNILHAINDYERVVQDALEAGANIIVTGAGLPLELPRLVKDFPDVEIVPIVSSARALKIICKKWKAAGKMPGAVIVEGPKSGGHQGAKYEELFAPEHQLEAILPPIKEERDKWGDFPIIAAGGIATGSGMLAAIALGADGVQIGSRFVATTEASVHPAFKEKVVAAGEGDTELTLKELAPVRLLKNGFYQQVKELYNTQQATVENLKALVGNRRTKQGMFEGDMEQGELEIGQAASLITKVQSVQEVIDEIITEYHKGIERLTALK